MPPANDPTDKTSLWLLPGLSGILIGTSYIPFPPWASLFCFVPLWLFWLRQTSLKRVIAGGLICSFVFTWIGFNWVTYLLHEFAHLPWPLAFVGMLLFALLAHLFVPIAGGLWYIGRQKFQWSERLSLWLLALITILSEAYSFTLFDWNFGYSWYASELPVYHWAEIIGFSGLSAITLLCNLPLLLTWQQRRLKSGKILLASVLVLILSANLTGIYFKNRLSEPDKNLTALLVQANIGNFEKHAASLGRGFRNEILNRYLRLTDKWLKANPETPIDFALWPETAFPTLMGPAFKHEQHPKILKRYLDSRDLALITGAYSIDPASRLVTNSLFVLDRQGDIVPPHYNKSILLAFGEYIPGEKIFPKIRDWLPAIGNFARGPGPTVLLQLGDYKIGPQICYESLFPNFSRSLANLGAQFIVNVTNDSWYGSWQEPYQHMYMTLARAVEFRRPLLRVTNTGISTVVLASGEILERSPLHQEWASAYQLPYLQQPPTTFYQQWFWLGPSVLWLSLGVLLVAGVVCKPAKNK